MIQNKKSQSAAENKLGSEKSTEAQTPLTPAQRTARLAGWMSFGVVCLIFFTLLKLPEDRIKNYVDGVIAGVLAEKGISFTATEGRLSTFFGLTYTMKDITLNFPPPNAPVHIDKLAIAPSILSMLFSSYGGKLWLENGKGSLKGSFSLKKTHFSFSYHANQLEIQKLGILPNLADFQASALVNGSGSLSGDYTVPSTLEGEIALTLADIKSEPQSIAGFSLPQINISDAVLEAKAEKGKAIIKTFRLGKATPTKGVVDDIQGALSGDITLAKQLDLSQLNLKVHFSFSESILKSFVLLDALLGAGKQPDGSYHFTITGPLSAPIPAPGN